MSGIEPGKGGYQWRISETAPSDEEAVVTTGTDKAKKADTVVSLGGDKYLYIYDTNPKTPHLLPSKVDLKDGDFEFGQYQTDLPEELARELTFESALMERAFNKEPILNKQQIDRLRMAHKLNGDVTFEEGVEGWIAGELAALEDETYEQIKKQFPDAKKGVDPRRYKKYLSERRNGEFENQLDTYAKEKGLDEAEKNLIRLAYYTPEKADEAHKTVAKNIEEKAVEGLNTHYGIKGAGQIYPKDNSAFIAKTDAAYDAAFTKLWEEYSGEDIKTYAENQGITVEEAKERLRHLFKNPEATYPGQNVLEGILNHMKIQAAANAGFPGVSLGVDNTGYNAIIQGMYRDAFVKELNGRTELSPAQQQAVMHAWNNPTDPAITNETKALVKEISDKAVDAIRSDYGLPLGWKPPVGPVTGGSLDPATGVQLQQAAADLLTQLNIAKVAIQKLPDGPDKMLLMDFIKQISKALTELKEMLYLLQGSDAQKAKELANAKMEDIMDKANGLIALQQKELEEVKKESKKQETLATTMKILGPILIAVTAIVFIATGCIPCLVMLAVITVMTTVKIEGKSIIAKGVEGLKKWADSIGIPGLAMVLEVTLIVALIVIAIIMPGAGAAAIMMLMVTLLAESGIIRDIIKEVDPDIDPQTLMWLEFSLIIAVSLAPGGASAAGSRVSSIAKAQQRVADAGRNLLTPMKKVSDALLKRSKVLRKIAGMHGDKMTSATVGTLIFAQAGNSTAEILMALSKARLAEIEGEYESQIEMIREMIKLLQKLIDNIMNELDPTGKMAEATGESLNSMWDGLHQQADGGATGILG